MRFVVFGGGWLATSCAEGANVDLYDLQTQTWTETPLGPGICGACSIDGVGTTWIRFELSNGEDHPGYAPYLQAITTGAVQPDPASSGNLQDDPNSSTAVGAPCQPLPGPALQVSYLAGFAYSIPYWYSFGNYVMTTGFEPHVGGDGAPDVIYKCGEGVVLHTPYNSFASVDAVLHQDQFGGPTSPIHGRLLPDMRTFAISKPKGRVAAVTNRTLYTISGEQTLWAATLAAPR